MIVAFAILGIVSTSIFSMMLTGTKTYTKLTNTVKVQYDAQLASAKIEKQLFNCNDAIFWTDDNQIILVQDNMVHAYCIKSGTKDLYYGTGELDAEGKANLTMYLLAENVNLIAIASPKEIKVDGKTFISYVQLQMQLQRNDKIYDVEKTVTLRNKPEFKLYQVTMPF